MNKERKNSSGIVKRTFVMIIIVLMVTTVFGSSTFIFNTPEPMVDENVDVPDISPISEDLNKALEDAGYEEYFAPEVEEITHDYSTPEQDHASDEIFGSDEIFASNEWGLESQLNKLEQPLAEDDLRYTGTQTRENPGLAYYGGAPEEASFASALEGKVSTSTETNGVSIPTPPIVHRGPEHPRPNALSILLVDDDNSPNNGGGYNINNVEEPTTRTYFQDSLNNLGCAYDLFVVPSGGDGPDLATLQGYDVVIWAFGYIFGFGSGPTLTANDQANLGTYLDGGGMLWLDGPLFLYELCGGIFGNTVWGPGDFAYDYMHLDQSATDIPIPTPNPLVGVAGSAEDGNSYATASYWTQFGLENYATECVPQAGALGEYLAAGTYHPECGVQWTNGHKVLYTGAEWTFIVDDGERDSSMDAILSFFNPTVDYGCLIDPVFSAQDTTPNTQVDYPLNITNIGITQPMDLFDLTYISFPLGWTVELFEDDGVTPLVDNNLDGNPDTNVIPSLGWKNIIARVTVPPGALGGDVDTAILTARSNNNPLYFSQATLETTVPPYGVEWDQISIDGWCRENDWNWFTVTVRNTAGFPDTFDLTSFSPMGWLYSFNETDGTPLVDTGGTPDVDTGIIPPLSEKLIKIRVEVPLGNPPGTIDNAIINATSVGNPFQVANLDLSIFVTYEVIYFEGVEFGEDDYTHYAIEGGPDAWAPSAARSYQDAFSWYSGVENAAPADLALESPYIFVPNVNANYAKLDFWHWYDIQDATGFIVPPMADGAIVECWDAGSQAWAQIVPDDGYDGIINPDWSNPLGGLQGFGLNSGGWQHEYFDILNYLNTGPITGTVVNEIVYGPSVGGEMGPLWLDNGGIINCSLLLDDDGEWTPLIEGADYTLNYATGEVNITLLGTPLTPGMTFYAYYNYSAGNVLKFRWRIGTDTVTWASEQWYIDNIRVRIPMFGSVIKPEFQEKYGFAGTEVSYDFTVENIGYQGTDDFNLEYQGIWPATIYDDSWAPVASTGPMIPGEIADFHLNVSIPGIAVGGDFDDALIWSNSTLDLLEYTNASVLTVVPYEPPYLWDATTWDLWSTSSSSALWHLEGSRFNSAPTSCAFNDGIDYDTGSIEKGSLYSPWVNLPAGRTVAEFSWWEWRQTENWAGYDQSYVYISTNGQTWTQLYHDDMSVGAWTKRTYDISTYIGNVIKLRFYFDTVDAAINWFEGWFVDDIEVLCPAYGAQWTPSSQIAFGDAGDIKSYDMTLKNIGEFTDTFTFTTTTTLGWPVSVYNDTWAIVADSDAIDPGMSKLFHANVTIPLAAFTTDTETTIITATSTLAPAYFADTTLTTFVLDAILLVSDDNTPIALGGGYMGPEYCALLNASLGGAFYDWIEVSMMGAPTLENLMDHNLTIWHTQGVGGNYPLGAWDTTNPLDASERAIIGSYLDSGGKMYMSGAGPIPALFQGYVAWYSQYFGMTATHWWPWGVPPFDAPIDGVAGNPISDGIVGVMYGPSFGSCIGEGASCSSGSDGVFDVAFTNPLDGYCVGTTLNSGGQRRVSTTFDLANVNNSGGVQQLLMDRILAFLDPDVAVAINPADQSWFGPAGTDVSYNLNIENQGKNPDNFNLALDSGIWPVTFYDLGWNPIVATGWLNPTESIDIYINVTIPGAALPGDADTSLVNVSSTVDPTVYEIGTLITSVPFNTPWFDDMESGTPGWSYTGGGTGIGVSEWFLTGNNPYSPVNSWYYGQDAIWQYDPGPNDGKLMTPWVNLPAGCMYAEMNVWHWYDFETMWDGGVVEITTDGQTWFRLTPERGYDGILQPGFGNVLENQETFTGSSGGYINDVFIITPFIGNTVKLRFWAGVDSWFAGQEGWYVDDIEILCPDYGVKFTPPALYSWANPGDTVTYSMSVQNIGRFVDPFDLTISTVLGWPATIYDTTWTPIITTGPLNPGESMDIYVNVSVPGAAPTSDTEVTTITATSTGDPSAFSDCTLTTYVTSNILVVDDDGDIAPDTGIYYTNAIDSVAYLGYEYDYFEVAILGKPSFTDLQVHQVVIWICGENGGAWIGNDEPVTATDRANIGAYLNGGGKMFWSSGGSGGAAFFGGYMGWINNYFFADMTGGGIGTPTMTGIDGNVIGDGLSFDVYPGIDGWTSPTWPGAGLFNIGNPGIAPGETCFDSSFGPNSAFNGDSGVFKTVYFSWDFAGIDGTATRDVVMFRILTWLLPPPYGVTISPISQTQYGFAGEIKSYDLNITSIGTLPDIYDITVTSVPLGWTVSLYEADGVTPLADTGGIPGVPDTGTVNPGGYYNIVVEVQVDALAVPGDFDVAAIRAESFNGPPVNATADLETRVPYYILLVDDDDSTNNGGPYNTYAAEDAGEAVGTPYADALTALGYDYDLYVVPSGADGPDLETLLYHPVVIWLCGYEWGWAPSLTGPDQNNLATFMDNGGKLWLNGPMIIYDVVGFGGPNSVSAGSFFYDYLKISDTYIAGNLPPNPLVGDPASIFAGASYGTASVWPTSWTGEVNILPLPNSLGGFASPTATLPYSANTYENGYQMCYLEFEFAFITDPVNQSDCAWRILNWFMPPEGVTIGPSPQNWYGGPGSMVWYNLTVKNTGFGGNDIFDMTYVSPLGWTYDFFESDMATPLPDTGGVPGVPDTGSIPTWATKDIAVRVTIPGAAVGGDIDNGIITATSFNNPAVFADALIDTMCYEPGQDYKAVYISYVPESDSGSIVTTWLDDFEFGVFGGSTGVNWTRSVAANADVGTQTSNSGIYSMYTWQGVVDVDSMVIDLSAIGSQVFEVWIRQGDPAFSEGPDPGEDLELYYLDDTFTWVLLETFLGADPWGTIYTRTYNLPANALHAGFQIRFHQTGASGAFDYWHIDDVHLYEQLPAPAETDQLLYNSAMWTGDTGGNVKLGIIDSWGTDNPLAWQSWAATHGDVDVVFIDKDPFTYGDLVASGADALVISHANSREYSNDEIAAIQQYAMEGHGLMATGGSMDFGVPNNVNLGPLFGLAVGFQPWSTPYTSYIMDEPLHPVMAGLPDPFFPGTALESCTMMTLAGATQLAHIDTIPTGLITAFEVDTLPPVFAGIQTCTDAGTGGTIDLGWFPATDPSTPITYNIYQAFSEGGQNFAAPTYTISEPALNYQVTGLVNGVSYYYVIRAEDSYGNEDTNTVELNATPTTRMFFQVQMPGIPGYQNLSYEPLEAALQTHTTDVAAPGQYLIGNVGWMTEAYAEAKDLSGPWEFHMWAYITDPAITGDLYIRCYNYSAAPIAMLFETGKSELVDGHTAWYEFIWTYDVPPGTVTQPGERIFLELWIDATAGGLITPVDTDTYVVSMQEILGSVDAGTFVNAQDDLDGDWATIRESGTPPLDVDTYVTTNTDTIGTTTNFVSAQSGADGGLFATLDEENTGGGISWSALFTETFSGLADADWIGDDGGEAAPSDEWWHVEEDAGDIVDIKVGDYDGQATPNSLQFTDCDLDWGGQWAEAYYNNLPYNYFDLSSYTDGYINLSVYVDVNQVNEGWRLEVTRDSGFSWIQVYAEENVILAWHTVSYQLVAADLVNGFAFRVNCAGSNNGDVCTFDDITLEVESIIPNNYEERIEFTTSAITAGSVYTLELNYSTSGEIFDVFVWDGGLWNDRGDLTSVLMTTWSYTLLPAEVIANEVRVQYRGQNEVGDAVQDTLNIEYHRVNSQAAGVDYRYDVQFNTTGIPFAATYTLEIYYRVSAEPCQLWFWNYSLGGFWEQIATLNSVAWTPYSYVLFPDHISAGEVRVRYVDDTQVADAVEDTIDIEYHRVNSFTAGGTPAQIVLGYDFAGQPSSVVMALNPFDPAGPLTTNVLAVPNPTNGANTITLIANVSDLGLGDNNIIAAEYFVDVIGADGTGIGMGPQDGAFNEPEEDVTSTIDISAWPDGTYTIYVHGQDTFGNWGACNSTVLNKTSMYQQLFMPGWILVSIPYEPTDTAITSVLSTIAGDYDYVQYYDATDPADPWKTYATFKPPSLNDLTDIHNTMGIWINILNPCVLTIYGYEPTSTVIDLYAGWNLVGYPARDDSSYNVSMLKADVFGATSVEGFNATAPYRISTLSDDYVLKRGEGYWIQVAFDTTWTVDW